MKILCSVLLGLLTVGQASGDSTILKYADVQFFRVREVQLSPHVSLEISGLAFHSSLAVSDITVQVRGTCQDVLVYLVPTQKGLSGSFDYKMDVPDDASSVCFGEEQKVIWQKKEK